MEALPGCRTIIEQPLDKYCGVKTLLSGESGEVKTQIRYKPLKARRLVLTDPLIFQDATPQKSFGFGGSHYPHPFCNQNIPQITFLLQGSPSALTAEQVSERGRLSTFLRFISVIFP